MAKPKPAAAQRLFVLLDGDIMQATSYSNAKEAKASAGAPGDYVVAELISGFTLAEQVVTTAETKLQVRTRNTKPKPLAEPPKEPVK